MGYPLQCSWASLVAQLVKNPPAMQETRVWSLGWEDILEKGKASYSSISAWRILWTTIHGVAKRWTRLSDFCFLFQAQSETHRVRMWIVTGLSGEAYACLSLRNTVLNILLNNMLKSTESQKMKFYFWFYFIKMKFYLFISNYRFISLVYLFINMTHSDWCPCEQVLTRAGDTVATCAPHLHWLLPGITCL